MQPCFDSELSGDVCCLNLSWFPLQFAERSVFHVRADVENSSKTFDEFLAFPGMVQV